MPDDTLFVVSDAHGHAEALARALHAAGFDPQNERHLFISCGDLFDRGTQNREVYAFVRALPRKVLIRGNHEDILISAVREGKLTVLQEANGTVQTFAEFLSLPVDAVRQNFSRLARSGILRALCRFAEEMCDFYERGSYIFTHGWLPLEQVDGEFRLVSDWRKASLAAWEDARWYEWPAAYDKKLILPGKTIVCGHRPASWGHRYFSQSPEPDNFSPFCAPGIAAIDGCTIRSGIVNVLVVEASAFRAV